MAVLSDELRAALRRAARAVVTERGQSIDAVALLAAMLADPTGVAARVLAGCEVSRPAFLAQARPDRVPAMSPPVIDEGPTRLGDPVSDAIAPARGPAPTLTEDVRAALDAAARDAVRQYHPQVTTGHVLLAVLDGGTTPAAHALASLGVTADAVRAAVGAIHGAETGDALTRLAASVPLPPPPPGALPRRWAALASIPLLLAWYAVALLLADATIPEPIDQAGLIVMFVAVVVIDVPLIESLTGFTARRVLRQYARLAPTVVALPDAVYDLAARYGVTRLETRVQQSWLVRDRAQRAGRRAWVVLAAVTLRSGEPLPFILGHELAHVMRNDSRRRRISFVCLLGIVAAAVVAGGPVTVAVGLAGGLAVWVGDKWLAEWGADAVAVRWVGIAPLRAWLAVHRNRLAQPANRTPRRRVFRALGLLNHPPLSWRLWRAERLARRPAMANVVEPG